MRRLSDDARRGWAEVPRLTRNDHDWTEKYQRVITSAQALRCQSAMIDGEMCVQNADGVTDFKAFKSAIN